MDFVLFLLLISVRSKNLVYSLATQYAQVAP